MPLYNFIENNISKSLNYNSKYVHDHVMYIIQFFNKLLNDTCCLRMLRQSQFDLY